jgi:hypothetical protein
VQARVPGKPELGLGFADGWTEQVETGLAEALGFFHPGAVVALQRLDRIRRVVLHTLEDDRPVALAGLDDGILHLEVSPGIHGLDLGFEQTLDGLVERLLNFAHANAAPLLVHDVGLDHELGKHVGFARASATPCAFIAAGVQKGQGPFWGWELQDLTHS